MTADSSPEPVRPGFRIIRGSLLTVPSGGLEVSLDEKGSPKFQMKLQVSIQVWVNWLVIAFARRGDTEIARNRMNEATASADDAAESTALNEEFHGALQTISAAVFALDAFYGIISTKITIDEKEKEARRRKKTGRAAWVTDAICRASRIPNEKKKTLINNIRVAYQLRDDAVHPYFKAEDQGIHPGLNQPVPKYYIDYTLETCTNILLAVVEAIMFVTDRPQTKNPEIVAYSSSVSSLLHEIVDEFLTYDVSGPFSSRSSDHRPP